MDKQHLYLLPEGLYVDMISENSLALSFKMSLWIPYNQVICF